MALGPSVIGGIFGGLAVLVYALLQPQRKCPDCGAPLPKFRKPSNKQQVLSGGWTCPKCGIDIDRKGRKRLAG